MYYLMNVRFKVPHTGEDMYFTKGDVGGYYEIINWQFNSEGEISYVVVGTYNGTEPKGARMTIQNTSIIWNNDEVEVSNNLIHVGFRQYLIYF